MTDSFLREDEETCGMLLGMVDDRLNDGGVFSACRVDRSVYER